MEIGKRECAAVEEAVRNSSTEVEINALSEAQLMTVGGGCGEVVFG